jgi:hypothetical protein
LSFLGKLFGSDAALEKVVDTASGLLDEAFYTDQEEAEDKAAARSEAQGLVIKWMEASTGSRLARRVIAFAITGTWLAMYWMTAMSAIAAIWLEDKADRLNQSGLVMDAAADVMISPVMLILGFYFAAPYMGDLAKGALQRFSSSGK